MTSSFPRTLVCDGVDLVLRTMGSDDEAALLAFAQAIPAHDLLFLPRDISEPKVIAAWVAEGDGGTLVNLLALDGDAIVGSATIVRDPRSWSRHVGELRVLLAPAMRGKGLGRKLMQACLGLAVDLGLEKLVAQMTVDQQGAIAVFQTMGFRPEALLHDHAKDRDGRKHDLVVLAHDVARFQAQMNAYGVAEAG
jgi:RimJ/RimL family protein N-acetyltransferase